MDTKWKSSDHKSVGTACAVVLVLTIIFMAFLPFFKERADHEFEDPFTENAFIRMLYESNYIQYKYLRERVDQKTYSFGNLYVSAEYIGTETENYGHDGITVYQVSEDVVAQSSALREEVDAFAESSVSELWEFKTQAQELTQMVDYYAVDKVTGASIGNSSQAALQEIAGGNIPDDNPYIYYVYLNYDSVGNLENCGVSSAGKVEEFLKRVESLGRECYLDNYYNENGICYVSYYNSYDDEYYRYRFTVSRPSNMKIVYAMTEAQYQAFIDGYAQYTFLPNYVYASENSYFSAGVTGTLLVFAVISMILGMGMVYLGNRKEAGAYTYQELAICKLPLEVNIVLFVCAMTLANPLVKQICAYQKGWFLPNLTRQLLEPFSLSWIRLPILAALFFLYFLAAYTAGSILTKMLNFKRYFKEHSMIYRYWDRFLTFLKNFYQELVNFDIGTDARRVITKLVVVNFIILAVMSMFWMWEIGRAHV